MSAGETAAVGGGAGGQVVWNLVAGYFQQTEKGLEDSGRVRWWLGRVGVETAEVHEQDPVDRLVVSEKVAGMDGELGLADATHTGQC